MAIALPNSGSPIVTIPTQPGPVASSAPRAKTERSDREQSLQRPDAAPTELTNQPPEEGDARKAKDKLNQLSEALRKNPAFAQTDLEFKVDDDTGRTVIKITDRETKELIRQIPSEEALRISKALGKLQGVLFEDKA